MGRMTDALRKGRRQLASDDEILEAAFESFAATHYDAMSVRRLNAALGLSHETVRQRFGSKYELYCAAVDHGVARFYELLLEERSALGAANDELVELRLMARAFIGASMRLPQLASLVNHEAGVAGGRLDYLFSTGFAPGLAIFADLLERLIAREVIYPVTVRDLFFIIDAGMSPFIQPGLSAAFDAAAGPLDATTHVERFLDFVVRGLIRPAARVAPAVAAD
ncbi:MAG: TetR/AcrR family transcriptional regulator [Acidobacteriota bacterium]|nr:TetR/AcrR family transcriptional regulator [Acidobacteriota bacterium]MDE3092720.1 TetR/AcrR family transcriptional regulator [Acidobacteriota bacterium]MDE3139348.1 TetR/AcrR family transcriptional regulator [Acidobacteriota bacterium]MDE3146997.1 TetR/AcrR family transcriptional regulator [Acidobacteriota bacterium]